MGVVSPILEKAGASYVINKLIDTATTYVRDQYYWKTDLLEELQSLRRRLPQIKAVVGFAEDRLTMYESSNPALMEWLCQFRDGIEEAEEVLDELEYLELEKKANRGKSRFSRTVDASVKTAKRILKFDDVLGRLRTCVKNLNTSASDVQNFLTLVTQKDGNDTGKMQQEILSLTFQSRITSSLPELSFKGREEEKGKIIQYLLGESVEESEIQMSENVRCLPLVAMGGMGKTALAQQVFDYFENVKKEHFHIKIWVCDSLLDLNASSLMKKILEYLTDESESGPLERLPVKLKEKLHSKRFLLVLDDAWDDKNQTKWEKLRAPLLYGQKGSWILLTTRLESVAKMVAKVIKGTMKPMMLRGLSNDECRSLFYEHAFASEDPSKFPLLTEIGEEIILKKLDGVPLLAKSIGGALNNKLEADHWISISRSELWKTPQDSKYDFIPALTLSYVMLPTLLKRCFSYCSIFPQHYQFEKSKLACMWVAAGLIYSDGSEEGSDEEIANYCFDILCNKSFFDVHTDNRSSFWRRCNIYTLGTDFYTMHDMMNGLACYVSRYECCRIVHDAPSYNLNDNAIRHLSITCSTVTQLHDLAKIVCKFQHLRTLQIEYDGDRQEIDDFIRDACKSSRRIRVLIMNFDFLRGSYQCLESISDFVKLRFLKMPGLFLLPSLSKCKFYFLQVLLVDRRVCRLVKDANKLTNLRHLCEVHEDALFSVAEVGKLTSLQELCFRVGTEPGYRVDELMNMANLRRLSIVKLSNVQSLEEVNKVNLVRKSSLKSLELDWDRVSSKPDLDQQEVLAALQPPPTISELIITGYEGVRPAPWMVTPSFARLELLQLASCTSWEELPPLWKLPCLKFLKLSNMKAIRSLGCHFSDLIDIQFPALEKLEFHDLPLWEEWNGADDYIWFPRLKSFEIFDCPKLKKIPDLPLSIENLHMYNLRLEALPRSYKCSNGSRTFGGFQQLMSFESLDICKCPGIVQNIGSIGEEDDHLLPSSLKELSVASFDKHEDLASFLRGLTSLTTLKLCCSAGMESLPLANELEHLTKLQRLHIWGGEALTSPGGLYIIKSLKHLMISNCPKFLSAKVESEGFLKDKIRKHAVSSASSIFDHFTSNKADGILPSSLEVLILQDSDISQEALGRCFHGLTSLKELWVSGCHHLVSLPNIEYLRNLTTLQTLNISDCEELCELESLTALVSLKQLEIKRCPKLIATTFSTLQNPATTTEQSATKKKKGTLLSLEKIDIDSIFYLPILPNPKKLNTLKIENSEVLFGEFISAEIEEWLLQCCESLEVLQWELMPYMKLLPASLESLSSLKYLCIYSAPRLKSLPRMPASLEQLMIDGCSAKLKKRCQENIGRDWPNINHIRYICIETDEEDKAKVQVNCNCLSNRLWSST